MREGEEMTVEPKEEGLLLKGRPSREETLAFLRNHASRIKSVKSARTSKLGELRGTYLEMEFDEGVSKR
jgi:hypothetical protein